MLLAPPARAVRRFAPHGRATVAGVLAALLMALLVVAALSAGAGPAQARSRRYVAPAPAPRTTTTVVNTPPTAKAWLVADLDNGRILAQQNEHQPLPPASLTKVLTAQIAADWLPPGDAVPVSARAATVYPDRVGMKPGQVWPLDIALHALLIASANDAAYALAEQVGGSIEAFAPVMDLAAQELGMTDNPVFHDPAGLDGTEGVAGGNLISARDLAIAARDLLADPALAQIVALDTFDFTGPDGIAYHLVSHNHAFLASYPGSIGVKTGFTDRAGECLIAAATRNGRTMLAVVMDGSDTTKMAGTLLDEAFATPLGAQSSTDVLAAIKHPFPLATHLDPSLKAPPVAVVQIPLPTTVGPGRVGPGLVGPGLATLQTAPGPASLQTAPRTATVPVAPRTATAPLAVPARKGGGTTGPAITSPPAEAGALAGVALLVGLAIGWRWRARRRTPPAHGARRATRSG